MLDTDSLRRIQQLAHYSGPVISQGGAVMSLAVIVERSGAAEHLPAPGSLDGLLKAKMTFMTCSAAHAVAYTDAFMTAARSLRECTLNLVNFSYAWDVAFLKSITDRVSATVANCVVWMPRDDPALLPTIQQVFAGRDCVITERESRRPSSVSARFPTGVPFGYTFFSIE
jgi:hypothetical protein